MTAEEAMEVAPAEDPQQPRGLQCQEERFGPGVPAEEGGAPLHEEPPADPVVEIMAPEEAKTESSPTPTGSKPALPHVEEAMPAGDEEGAGTSGPALSASADAESDEDIAGTEQAGGAAVDPAQENPAQENPAQEGPADPAHEKKLAAKRKAMLSRLKAEKLTLRQLEQMAAEAKAAFAAKDDTLHKTLASACAARAKKKRKPLEAALTSGVAPRNVKDWEDMVAKCAKELSESDALLVDARSKLEARRKSHREPIAAELAAHSTDGITLRKLAQLQRRAAGELGSRDPLQEDIAAAMAAREKSHKSALVAVYTKLMKGKLKDMSVRALNEFVRDCEAELDPEDPLLAQARSACEARVLDKGNPAKAKPVGRKKKDKSGDGSKKDKAHKDGGSGGGDVVLDMGEGSSAGRGGDHNSPKKSVYAAVTAVAHEFSGVDDSIVYKVFYLVAFVMFTYIMVEYVQMVIQVAPLSLFEDHEPAAAAPAEAAAAAASEGG